MLALVAEINFWLALGTIVLQAAAVILLFFYFAPRYAPAFLSAFIAKNGIFISFLLALGAAGLTLLYSEVFGFIPCGLCWFERVFLYPQVILFGIALWRGGVSVAEYSIGLSIPGAIISLYHHYIQVGGTELLPCPAAGIGADCAKRILFEFGYVTFPLMAFSAFVFLIVMMMYVRRSLRG